MTPEEYRALRQSARERRQSPHKLQLPQYGWLPKISKVQVMTHSRCNADCVFCPFIESTHAQVNKRMNDTTWRLILANLIPFADGINGPDGKFCPYLMQEPLIDPTIFDKIADVYRTFPKTCVEISTNGAALTDKVSDKLFAVMDGKRHDIWVSHHGIDSETFTHIMAMDYEKATSNLIAMLKKSDGRFTIKIRGAGESRDGKHVFFTRQQYLDYWNQKFDEHSINRQNVSVDAFTFHDRAGSLHRTDRGANLLNLGVLRVIDQQNPFYCPRLDEWIHFAWDGSLRLCCHDYHHEVKLPNINDMTLLDYFHSQEHVDLISKVSGRTTPEAGFICTRCSSIGG